MAEEEVEVVLDDGAEGSSTAGGSKLLVLLIAVIVIAAVAVGAVYVYRDAIFGDGDGDGDGDGNNDTNGNGPDFVPQASINAPNFKEVNVSIMFTASSNLQSPVYDWNFGDIYSNGSNPNTASGQAVSHTFTEVGTYTVTLEAHNDTYNATDTHEIIITAEAPPTVSLQEIAAGQFYEYKLIVDDTSPANVTALLTEVKFIIYNGTDWSDESTHKLNGTLSSLTGPVIPTPQDPEVPPGLYFEDSNSDASLSVNDILWFAGDAGCNLAAGDSFILIYTTANTEMCEPVVFPEQSA